MELEDELILEEDDIDINFGFPRPLYVRYSHFEGMDDLSFYRRFRLTKETVIFLLDIIQQDLQLEVDLNNNFVSPMNQLLATLLFYGSDSHRINIGNIMLTNKGTLSRIIIKVTEAIARLCPRFINMPTTQEEIQTCQNRFYEIARFPRVVGCIDCTHVKIESPGGNNSEMFRNRKQYFSINVQVVCDADLMINNIVARWPGSARDATIFNNSRLKFQFENRQFGNGILLGDRGYPLKPYLLTPLRNPAGHAEHQYNESHTHTRSIVEQTISVWKRRFPVLSYGLRCKIQNTLAIIVATAVLHNIAKINNDIPLPHDIHQEGLEHIIQEAQVNQHQTVNYNFRTAIINNYFSNL